MPKYFPGNPPDIKGNLDKRGKFCDKEFPNNINSLFNEKNELITYKNQEFYQDYLDEFKKEKEETENNIKEYNLEWKRISDLISFELDEENKKCPIKQNELGDCYFISLLRRLKEVKPSIYYSLIRYYDFNIGYYEINFYDNNGEEVIVYVDDYILVYPNRIPLFANLKNDEKYAIGRYLLIEKAFAKMNGSYFNINGGYQGINASYAITGINPIIRGEKFFNLEIDSIYKVIKEELDTENILLNGSKDSVSLVGIEGGHMYSVISVEEDYKSNIKIIGLDNPWGENHNMENFSLNLDSKYNYIEKEIKDFNINNEDNGKLKILIKNLKEEYDLIEIVEFNEVKEEATQILDGCPSPQDCPSWRHRPPEIKGDLKRKGFLEILGVDFDSQKKFFGKYKNDIDKGIYELTVMFNKYGTNKDTFYKFMGIQASGGFFSMINPLNFYHNLFGSNK